MAELNMLMLAVPLSKVYLGPQEGWKGPGSIPTLIRSELCIEVLDLKCGQILRQYPFLQ